MSDIEFSKMCKSFITTKSHKKQNAVYTKLKETLVPIITLTFNAACDAYDIAHDTMDMPYFIEECVSYISREIFFRKATDKKYISACIQCYVKNGLLHGQVHNNRIVASVNADKEYVSYELDDEQFDAYEKKHVDDLLIGFIHAHGASQPHLFRYLQYVQV